MNPRSSPHQLGGFSLAEIMVAIGLCVIAFTCFFAATGQAVRMAQGGKQETLASQVLQHRFETFHANRDWNKTLDPAGVANLLTATAEASGGLHEPAESYVISAYPAGTPSFTVNRAAQGTITTSGAALPASVKTVKIAGQLAWTGVGDRSRIREQVTLLTKGGI